MSKGQKPGGPLVPILGEIVKRKRIQTEENQESLAHRAEISESTLRRIERGQTLQVHSNVRDGLAVALGVPSEDLSRELGRYQWDKLSEAVEMVAAQMFTDQWRPDAILTFSAAASIFAGLVLVALKEPATFLKIPVFTALLTAKGGDAELDPYFDRRETLIYDILVPKALLLRRYENVLLLDEVVHSGAALDGLREWLRTDHCKSAKVACAIQFNAAITKNRFKIDLVCLNGDEKREKVMMPWGIESYQFEDGFPQSAAAAAAAASAASNAAARAPKNDGAKTGALARRKRT